MLDWLDPVSALASALLTVLTTAAILWKPAQRWVSTMRSINGWTTANGKHKAGLIDDVAEMRGSLEYMSRQLRHVVDELKPNHGSSVKDVVNSIKGGVEEMKSEVRTLHSQQQTYHNEGVARDAAQDARLTRSESNITDLQRAAAVLDVRLKNKE